MSNLNELINILNLNEKVFIQTHNFPDPDAIASAAALKYLLSSKGIDSDICYAGNIEKFTTKKLIKKLHIDMKNIKEIDYMNEMSNIILVDTQKTNSNTQNLIGKKVACIDHHKYNGLKYNFQDIRENVGACSSIITKYFLDEKTLIPEELATALIFGIKMDTLDFTRGVNLFDIQMYAELYGKEDSRILDELHKDKLLLKDLKAFSNALDTIKVIGETCFVNVGNNCAEAILATVSDFLLSLEEANFVVAYSFKDAGIKFSVRSQTEELDAAEIVSKALGEIGSGGGHKEMAGGIIPKSNLHFINEYLDEYIEKTFMYYIGQSSLNQDGELIIL